MNSIPLSDLRLILLKTLVATVAIAVVDTESIGAQPSAVGYSPPSTYLQEFTIRFRDEASAAQAALELQPLLDGHYRAVSCRWDDNWTSDNAKTRELMEECGIRGTWYLNGRTFSPENKPADYTPIARKLLEGGNSVGGHSMTHPYVTYFHSNRMFAEMAGVRIDWEAALDKPVTSYAYSFVDVRPEPEGRDVMIRTLETLDRAGFYHVATYDFFNDIELGLEFSPIMPPENSPIDVFKKAVEWAYNDPGLSNRYPMISNSMHAWYDTARSTYGYDELRKRFAILNVLDDVWHCNQNEYAAYRRQFRVARVENVQRDGQEMRLFLQRPVLLALNDNTPLTLAINGVSQEDIVSVDCDSADVTFSDRKLADKVLLHIHHNRDERLPVKIGHLTNPENAQDSTAVERDPDFPDLEGILWNDGDRLHLDIRNTGTHSLENLRINWRVPIGWEVQPPLEQTDDCKPGEMLRLSQQLVPVGEPLSRIGKAHFAVQADFVINDLPGRIHFTCQASGERPDDSFPLEGFALLGPIPNEQFDLARFERAMGQNGCPNEWSLADGEQISWRENSRDGYVTHQWLNPEYVRTMGTWDHVSPTYVLRSKVHSSMDRPARIVTSHEELRTVMVNGQKIESDQFELKSGDNELIIVYPGSTMSTETPRLSACFVRLFDPVTGDRLRDIRYRAF